MKGAHFCFFLAVTTALLAGCQAGEDAFVGDRLHILCDEAYWVCGAASGCVLDENHYVEGVFPGTRRVTVKTEDVNTEVQVRIYFSTMESPGTEFLIQLYEHDCTLNSELAAEHLVDVDVFEKAGDKRTLYFDLLVAQAGEHLLEIYADVSAEYVMLVDVK